MGELTGQTTDETTVMTRGDLVRKTAILQVKLLVDGLRDAVLIPVSLIAAGLGLLRGGPDMDQEFNTVLDYGRHSEHWINLFGNHPPTGSLDALLHQLESVITEQYRKGRTVEEAKAAVKAAMDTPGETETRSTEP